MTDDFLSLQIELVRRRVLDTLAGMPPELEDLSGHLSRSEGKLIRARLLISAACCGRYDPSRVLTAASAVELLHLGTLIHDDIIDHAHTRRGQPSLQAAFGAHTAVLTGDYLFCAAFSLLSGLAPQGLDEMARAVRAVCVGEILQHRFRFDHNLPFSRYLRVIAGKTAALFGGAMGLGAREGGLSRRDCVRLSRVGLYLGYVFQMTDDCLDISPRPETGKPPGQDIREGVASLPLLLAVRRDPSLSALLLQAHAQPELLPWALERVRATDAPREAAALARRYAAKASALLERLPSSRGVFYIEEALRLCYTRVG